MLMDLLRAVFALAATLGLFALGVYAARRWGPKGLLQITAPGSRRLNVVETLSLDPSRRLVLVRLDGQDRLFLLGEGQELTPPSPPNASNKG
jgi:flagellar protein FliO/FliZ